MRILIAEDDQVLADGLLRALRSAGAAVDRGASAPGPPPGRRRGGRGRAGQKNFRPN